jgi:hypothetical protein
MRKILAGRLFGARVNALKISLTFVIAPHTMLERIRSVKANRGETMALRSRTEGALFMSIVRSRRARLFYRFLSMSQSWTRLSEQLFRFDMWSSAGVRLPSGEAAA